MFLFFCFLLQHWPARTLLCFQQSLLCNASNLAFILCRHLFLFFHFCHHITVSLSHTDKHTHTHTHTETYTLHNLIFTILFYAWDYFNNCLVDGYIPSHNFHVFCATATSTAINLPLILFYLIIHVYWSSANSYFIARLLMLSEQIIFWIFMSEQE